MFEFMNMAGTYKFRKIANYKRDSVEIDTALVTDGERPYETGIAHTSYRGGEWVIVEAYHTKEEALMGHNRCVKIMTDNPPKTLTDCCNSSIQKMAKEAGSEVEFTEEL